MNKARSGRDLSVLMELIVDLKKFQSSEKLAEKNFQSQKNGSRMVYYMKLMQHELPL
jgi:hypothetical protein